jgi:hypothetical protein
MSFLFLNVSAGMLLFFPCTFEYCEVAERNAAEQPPESVFLAQVRVLESVRCLRPLGHFMMAAVSHVQSILL